MKKLILLSCLSLLVVVQARTSLLSHKKSHHSTVDEYHHQYDQKNTQFIRIKNELSKPLIINFMVENQAKIGYFGYFVQANSQQELDLHEFCWFAPVAAGGFGKVREEKTMEILKHAFANKAEIIIPGKETRTVELKKDHNEIVIN